MMGMMGMETLIGPPMPPDPVFGVGTDAFLSLLRLIGNPDAAKQRLKNIYEAVVAANEVIRQANEDRQTMLAERKAHDEALKSERTEHDQSIAKARAKHDSECAAASQEIKTMRANAEKLQAQTANDAKTASELRADLERRLEAIRGAAL
jgi:hypothetical protein